MLRRLRDRNLLEKQGAGNRTHYVLVILGERTDPHPEQGKLMLEPMIEGGKFTDEGGKLRYHDLPPELAILLPQTGQRLSALALRQLIRTLCRWRSMRGEELATCI